MSASRYKVVAEGRIMLVVFQQIVHAPDMILLETGGAKRRERVVVITFICGITA